MKFIYLIIFVLTALFVRTQDTIYICAGETKTVNYFATSIGEGKNKWTINGQVFVDEEISYTYSKGGYYNISLIRENGPCYVEQTHQVLVVECYDFEYWIPNSFTPDDDDINQYFGPVISNNSTIEQYDFKIYNRWGEVVFSSNDINKKWDGTYKGIKCFSGNYLWSLELKFQDNVASRIHKTGQINLFR